MRALLLVAALGVCAPLLADGWQLRGPSVLYDAPSLKARALFILSGGHPLKEVSRVDGWRKVFTHHGNTGWVLERRVAPLRSAVVTASQAAVRAAPNANSPVVFYAARDVMLEVLGGKNGWLEVLHPDGETGHVAAVDVWIND
ncbi:SH3 domain-containing protein [Candidatus Persebacteraceae bacterium Df01]|jgi:SH3-like domain-containing protein|uniref:SH3 domain-containing protein n=1 Tax=Candidatus Doriopsillibacter californiensis TaxID=2970740 RepID=A0ABT7QKV0_9GAMM|nr:SH3 domain-containing protein [Candidatus Persebacteraceae bacterium Df01]